MRKIYWTVFALLLSFGAQAGTVICGGTVDNIGMHAPGKLMLKLSSMNKAVFICDTNQEWTPPGTAYTTSQSSCLSIQSMLMQAKAENMTLGGVYFDGDEAPATCTNWGDWKKVNIRYFLY